MKLVFALSSIFVLGLVSGMALSSAAPIAKIPAGNPQPVVDRASSSSKETTVHSSLLYRIGRLEHQVKLLTNRLEGLKSHHLSVSQSAQNGGKENAVRTSDEVFDLLKTAMELETSEVRQTVGEIVRDEFRNMRTEWGAFRNARRELREEELLDELSSKTEVDERERNTMVEILQRERLEIGDLRRKSRETFDIKGGRDATKARRLETDKEIKTLLGAERSVLWKRIRESRRPPWRR
jgi:hypothetical protein